MAWAMLKASVLLAVMGKVDVTVEFDEADPRIVRLQRASLFLANVKSAPTGAIEGMLKRN